MKKQQDPVRAAIKQGRRRQQYAAQFNDSKVEPKVLEPEESGTMRVAYLDAENRPVYTVGGTEVETSDVHHPHSTK